MVVRFRAIEGAELQRDVPGSRRRPCSPNRSRREETPRRARRAIVSADLCAERLRTVQAIAVETAETSTDSAAVCPDCGQGVRRQPVRCRYYARLFV